jgi:hypothetical protein
MTKKRPDATAIMSELRRDSVFFNKPEEAEEDVAPAPPTRAEPAIGDAPAAPASVNGAQRIAEALVAPSRPARRKKVRHPFDIYEDQLEALRDLSTDDRRLGGAGSMSEMVREALERYLPEKKDLFREALDQYFAQRQEERR